MLICQIYVDVLELEVCNCLYVDIRVCVSYMLRTVYVVYSICCVQYMLIVGVLWGLLGGLGILCDALYRLCKQMSFIGH